MAAQPIADIVLLNWGLTMNTLPSTLSKNIPPSLRIDNPQNGQENAWIPILEELMKEMYFVAQNETTEVSVTVAGVGTGFLIFTPTDIEQFEMQITFAEGVSDYAQE